LVVVVIAGDGIRRRFAGCPINGFFIYKLCTLYIWLVVELATPPEK
jgi:hypothetical protein